jgi:hypothetical protein
MTKLADYLNADEPQFSHFVHELEKATHHTAKDVQLIADVQASARTAMKTLKLDHNDTTITELHHALQIKLQADTQKLSEYFTLDTPEQYEMLLPQLKKHFPELFVHKLFYGLRLPVARKILQQHPPVRLMSILGYHSMSALLKNEDIWTIYACSRLCETSTWQRELIHMYNSLSKKDFTKRQLTVVFLPPQLAGIAASFVNDKQHYCIALKELGLIAIAPPKLNKVSSLMIIFFTLFYAHELKYYSKLYDNLDDYQFGQSIAAIITHDTSNTMMIGGQKIDWHSAQRALDSEWLHVEDMLATILPSMLFWTKTNYTLVEIQGSFVSCNLFDVLMSLHHNHAPGYSPLAMARRNLWRELYGRYIKNDEKITK